MAIILDSFSQGSEQWFRERVGSPGGSTINKIITSTGVRSKQRDAYLLQLAGEKVIGRAEETYQNQAMLNGIEREGAARALFEMIYGVDVRQVGIVFKDERRLCHVSPDGLVRSDAVLELKNPSLSVAVRYLLEKKVPADYLPQCYMEMYVCERELCYFMSVFEGLAPLIIEVHRNEPFIKRLTEELDAFAEDLAETVRKIEACGGFVRMAQVERKLSGATNPWRGRGESPAEPQVEEYAPSECPDRPGTKMTKKYCDKTCKDRLGCVAWQ